MSRSFEVEVEGALVTKISISTEHVNKYLLVSHTNTSGQLKVFERKLGLFRDQIIGGGWGMGCFSFTVS